MLNLCIYAMGTFILTPNVVKEDNSEFELHLVTPINLNPNFEWEAGIIDGYIPIRSNVKTTITSTTKNAKGYWFRYIIEKEFRSARSIDYKSYEKFYYNPNEYNSHAESFINKFHEIERKKLHYGEFTKQYYPPTLQMSIENDHMVIKVIRKMERADECVAFMLPFDQYIEFFGSSDAFETYYKGQRITPKPGYQDACIYDYKTGILIILASEFNTYNTDEEHDPTKESYLGVEFRSVNKIKKHTTGGGEAKTKVTGTDLLFDVECNLIETNKLGSRGDKVMDIMNMNGHENIHPKYFKLEMIKANYISVKIRKSSDKSRIKIEGKPYIVINIRPRI